MILRTSAVAVCCSSASTSSRSRVWSFPSASASRCRLYARRVSRSRTLVPSSLGDLRATEDLASLDFAGFGPRPISLPLPPMNRPGTGYGERARLGNYEQLGLAEGHPWDLLMRTA